MSELETSVSFTSSKIDDFEKSFETGSAAKAQETAGGPEGAQLVSDQI